MKRTARYNISVRATCANLLLANMTIVSLPDEDARLQLSNALYLIGEAVRAHEQDVMRIASMSSIRVDIEVTEYKAS